MHAPAGPKFRKSKTLPCGDASPEITLNASASGVRSPAKRVGVDALLLLLLLAALALRLLSSLLFCCAVISSLSGSGPPELASAPSSWEPMRRRVRRLPRDTL